MSSGVCPSRFTKNKKQVFSLFPGFILLAGLIVSGCSQSVSDPTVEPRSRSAFSWAAPTVGIDSGSGLAVTPRIAVEPDPADNDGVGPDDSASGAISVWLERKDIDPSDLKPPVYHIYAKRAVAGVWEAADSTCPFGFPFDILDDGVCLIDNANPDYDAIDPRVAMDSLGNATAVWQEFDPVANRSRIYARRYIMGTGWEPATMSIEAPSMGNAVSPDIGMEPDGGGDAIAVWSQFFSDLDADTWELSFDGGQEDILSIGHLANDVFAGQGSSTGDSDLFQKSGATWPLVVNGTVEEISAIAGYADAVYFGMGTATGNGDILVRRGASLSTSLNGTQEGFLSLMEHNNYLYAGQGSGPGDGDIYGCHPQISNNELSGSTFDDFTCFPSDWLLSYDGATEERVESFEVFNGRIYAGFGSTASGGGTGDIRVCTDLATLCLGAEWILAYDGSEEAILSLKVFNGLLYAGQGIDSGDGDILVCDPAIGGDLTLCEPGEWSTAYDGAASSINALETLKGFLFAGQGGAAGEGDVLRCSVGVDDRCDPSPALDWTVSFDGAQEAINTLETHLEVLYAGQGSGTGDGDIYQYKVPVGWRGMARRFSGGVWAATDAVTGCTAGGINPDDGVCDFDESLTSISAPRIDLANSGEATVAYHRFDPLSCIQSGAQDFGLGGPFAGGAVGYDDPTGVIDIVCKASRAYGNRFQAGVWGAPVNLTPIQNIIDGGGVPGAGPPPPINENCEDIGNSNGRKSENIAGSSACLWVSEITLTGDGAGNAYVAFKTHERAALTNNEINNNQPPQDALDVHERKSVFVRKFTAGGSWDATPVAGITDYEYSPRANNTLLISDCPSVNLADTEDNVVIMNCDFRNLTLASKRDNGTRAMVAYERYDGAAYDIAVHRYNGAAFGSVTDADNCADTLATCWHNVDNGTGEAHVPSVAMDNNGNAVLVWVEEDVSGRWRVYANRCAENAGDCIWSGPVAIDSGIGGEYYFEPRVAMETVNAGNASAVDCGGTGGVNCGDAFSVYNVLNSIFNFRIDASQWSPP